MERVNDLNGIGIIRTSRFGTDDFTSTSLMLELKLHCRNICYLNFFLVIFPIELFEKRFENGLKME